MNIINATWEKRNLGVDCREFEVSEHDDLADIDKALTDCNTSYQIVKVPVGSVNKQLLVQNHGFMYFETNIQLERIIKEKQILPNPYRRFEKDISYRQATSEEIEKLLCEVEEGKMFTTDKVAQDPSFSSELSGRRYALWSRDKLSGGAYTVLGLFKNEIASFTIYEKKERYFQAFIGGCWGSTAKGLGFIPLYVTGCEIVDRGGGILKTGVSSNNPSILRLQLQFGCQIKEMTNIYIKHI